MCIFFFSRGFLIFFGNSGISRLMSNLNGVIVLLGFINMEREVVVSGDLIELGSGLIVVGCLVVFCVDVDLSIFVVSNDYFMIVFGSDLKIMMIFMRSIDRLEVFIFIF